MTHSIKQLLFALLLISFSACEIENELPVDEIRQAPQISISDATSTEADENTIMEFEVKLSWDYDLEVQVDYKTKDVLAEAGKDYTEGEGTLTFAPGETSKMIPIEILGENIFEGTERFKVELSNPVNARILILAADGTILNDDSANDLVIPTTGYSTPLEQPGFDLVWQDEFEGTALNGDNWVFDIGTGNGGWGNQELQYYTEDNYKLEDGYLVIEAREEPTNGSNYSSTRIKTQGKQQFRFGRIDIRAVLPEGQGLWPALWMLGTKFNAIGWPACGEIDIMELVGHQPNRVHGTVHYGPTVDQRQEAGSSKTLSGGARFSEEFHVFSLIWVENKVQFLVDDEIFHEVTPATTSPYAYPFNDNFFFIFNVAVGGLWPGSPDETTVFPQRMIVDYVRVFQ